MNDMLENKILFLAYTKSQILNAIVLRTTVYKDYVCDLCYRSDLESGISFNYLENTFDMITRMPYVEDSFKNRLINRVVNYFKVKTEFSKSDLKNRHYSMVFFSGKDYRVIELFYLIKVENPSLKLMLYEEGVNEYYCYSKEINLFEKLYYDLFFGKHYIKEVDSLFVYDPLSVDKRFDFEVKKIPSISKLDGMTILLNNIFRYSKTKLNENSKQVVFLDQIMNEYGFDEQWFDDFQSKILHSLSEHFGNNNIYIKLHPRSKENKYGDKYKYLHANYPFELIVLNENIDNKIFVSICSSGLLNIKWIFNKEPIIISFNSFLIKDSTINAVFDRARNNIVNNNFFVPHSYEEFLKILNELTQR